MKRVIAFSAAVVALLMVSFVFLQTSSQSAEENARKVAEKQGILESDIANVTEVDFNDLPDGVSIKDITDSNVGLFKIDSKTGKPTFVITFSNQGFQRISQPSYSISFMTFGIAGEKNTSAFMSMSSGVKGSLNKGYVMTREGSIIGISTNLEITEGVYLGSIQVLIYKNGELVGLGNMFEASSNGVKNDYDIQSRDIVNFNPGDVLSVYVSNPGLVKFSDATTTVEISTSGN